MSGDIQMGAGINPRSASIEAVIIRADGTREYLGEVAYYHRNPLKHLWWHIKHFFKGAR